jgi:hypothetical protein
MRKTDRRRINATETETLRRSTRISKLDRKTNEYIREELDVPDTILDETTRKQLIWYGHVERMDLTRLPKFMIFTTMSERDLRMGEWKNKRQWNMEVGRRGQTF